MKTRIQLEKDFIEYLDKWKENNISCFEANVNDGNIHDFAKVNRIYAHHRTFNEQIFYSFFLNEMIPGILSSILPEEQNIDEFSEFEGGYNRAIEEMRDRAKILYNITI